MATALLIAALTDRYREAAERAISLVGAYAGRHPTAFGHWLQAIDFALAGVIEIAVIGDPDTPDTRRLLDAALAGFRPHQVIAVGSDPAATAVPLLQGRFALGGRPTAFVCRHFACRQPVNEPEALRAVLLAM
jgi:uncharacterized protein YyaL (SSP411 family)